MKNCRTDMTDIDRQTNKQTNNTREMQSIMGRAKVEWCLFVIVYIYIYKNGNINLKIYDQYEYD